VPAISSARISYNEANHQKLVWEVFSMRINPPKKVTVWISIFAFVVGMLLAVGVIPGLAAVGFIVVGLSYLLLVAGLFIKGL
jgi:hypothetical protein